MSINHDPGAGESPAEPRVSLERAIDVVLKCSKGYRLPETTRYAHRVAGGEKIPLSGGQMGLL